MWCCFHPGMQSAFRSLDRVSCVFTAGTGSQPHVRVREAKTKRARQREAGAAASLSDLTVCLSDCHG